MAELILGSMEHTDEDRVYIQVNKHFDVRIIKTDEGIVIDVFRYDGTGEPIATTYAWDSDACDEEDDNG